MQRPGPQWNASQPVPQQNFQPPSRSNSIAQNPYFRTPGQPNHSLSRQQSFDNGSKGFVQQQQQQVVTPITPAPNQNTAPQYIAQAQHQSPVKPESTSNSVTSTLNTSGESTIVVEVPKEGLGPNPKLSKDQVIADEESEEGEYGPEDEAEELFQWEYEHAFEEQVPKETVALAQPLSASFNTTPVPLIQAWTSKVPSISRYARKDNVTEYVRTIRSSPQWTYLQEDPAFAEIDLDGPLIPFDDVPEWAAARHQLMFMKSADSGEEVSRKRSRDEDGADYADGEALDQDDNNDDIAPANKRQKQEVLGDIDDETMQDIRGTTPGSIVLMQNARGGTPCLVNNLDDTWAPESGERATSPPDPTEQLLASLGVSGEAKPVQQQELPPYTGIEADASSRNASQTPASSQFAQANPAPHHVPPPQNFSDANGTPINRNRSMSNTPMTGMQANQNNASYSGGSGQNMNMQTNGTLNNNFVNNHSNDPVNSHTNGSPHNAPPMNNSQMSAPNMNAPPMQGPPMAASSMNGPYMGAPSAANIPARHTQVNGTPISAPNMNNSHVSPVAAHSYGPPVNPGYVPVKTPIYRNALPQTIAHQPNPPPVQPVNNVYGAGSQAHTPHIPPTYGPSVNTQYVNGPPNNYAQGVYQGPPQGPPQYAQNPSPYPGTPIHGQQGYNQFGPPQTYAPGPQPVAPYSQPQYGPPQPQAYGNGPVIYQQPAPQYGPPQPQPQVYVNQQQPSNVYGAAPQMNPAQYGPQQVQQYQGNGPYQSQPYSNGPTSQYANGTPASFESSNGPPTQMPVNNYPLNAQPQRQDSGYYSAGGFQNSGSAVNEHNGRNGPHQNGQQMQQAPNGSNSQNGNPPQTQQNQQQFNNENAPPQQAQLPQGLNDNDQNAIGPSPSMKHESVQPSDQPALQDITNLKADSKKNIKQQDSEATLTDLERELLGELEPAPIRRNPSRKAALKKPQPVVEAAYGYE